MDPVTSETGARAVASAIERTSARWTALVVVAVGLVASIAFANALRRAEELRLHRDVELKVEAASKLALDQLDRPLAALHSQMEVWGKHGPRPHELWVAEAERFLGEHPGFEGLARKSASLGNAVAAQPEGLRLIEELAQLIDAGGKAAAPDALHRDEVVGPVRLSGERVAMGIQLPLVYGDQRAAILAAVDPAQMVAPLLSVLAPRHTLELEAQGVEILRLGEAPANEGVPFAREQELRPSFGPPWLLRVTPSAELVAERLTDAPTWVLGAGVLISALLAAVVHLGQIAGGRRRALLDAQLVLEQRMAEAERAEHTLRELHHTQEERVNARTAELRDAVLELETFVYSVSHDLRSPLGAIVNFAAILAEDQGERLDAAGRDHLARISRSAQSAVAMMNALLAFSRTGRQEMHRSWVDVEEMVRSVAAELALSGAGPKPVLVVDRLPPAFADPSMLRLVFQNLLSNALKFSRPGTQPRIEVVGRETDLECEYAVIDDGVGFDMRHATKLFRVFERLHAADDFPGDGVGLAIVARVIRRHGGRITAEGAPDKGATFRFTLLRK